MERLTTANLTKGRILRLLFVFLKLHRFDIKLFLILNPKSFIWQKAIYSSFILYKREINATNDISVYCQEQEISKNAQKKYFKSKIQVRFFISTQRCSFQLQTCVVTSQYDSRLMYCTILLLNRPLTLYLQAKINVKISNVSAAGKNYVIRLTPLHIWQVAH